MVILPLAAQAQELEGTIDGHGFQVVPGDGDLGELLTMWQPERQGRHTVSVAAYFEYAKAPVTAYLNPEFGVNGVQVVVDDLIGTTLTLQYAPGKRVALGLSAPLWFAANGYRAPVGASVGDLRFWAPIGLMLPDERNLGLGITVIPFVDIPLGLAKPLLTTGFGGGLLFAVGAQTGSVSVAGNLGFTTHPLDGVIGVVGEREPFVRGGGQRMFLGLGGGYAFSDDIAIRLEARFEPPIRLEPIFPTDIPGELTLTVRGHQGAFAYWTAGAAVGLLRGPGAATFRLFLSGGISGNRQWHRYRTYDPDDDHDGMPASTDRCPATAETVNGWHDEDGCPDALSHATVRIYGPDGPLEGATLTADGVEVTTPDDRGVFDLGQRMPGGDVALVGAHRWFAPHEAMVVPLQEGETQYKVRLRTYLPGTINLVARGESPDGFQRIDGVATFDGPRERAPVRLGSDGEEIVSLYPGEWTVTVDASGYDAAARTVVVAIGQERPVSVVVDLPVESVEGEGTPEPSGDDRDEE